MHHKKWEHTLDVSLEFYTGDDDRALETAMIRVSERVERWQNAMFPLDTDLEAIADDLVNAAYDNDINWFNELWDMLYDWADTNSTWIKTRT